MITYERQIMSIIKITNMKLIDRHKPDLRSKPRDVIFITLANGEVKRLDLFSDSDFTNIDYWEYEKTWYSRKIILFKHWNIEEVATPLENEE